MSMRIDTAQRVGRRLRDGKLLANAALVRFGAGVPDDKHRALLDLTEPIPLLPADAPVLVDLLCAAAALLKLGPVRREARRVSLLKEQVQ